MTLFEQRLKIWYQLNAIPEMREYFKTIPEMSQKVLRLHFEEKVPLAEIAVLYRVSESTARHYHNYGLFLLTREMKKYQEE